MVVLLYSRNRSVLAGVVGVSTCRVAGTVGFDQFRLSWHLQLIINQISKNMGLGQEREPTDGRRSESLGHLPTARPRATPTALLEEGLGW